MIDKQIEGVVTQWFGETGYINDAAGNAYFVTKNNIRFDGFKGVGEKVVFRVFDEQAAFERGLFSGEYRDEDLHGGHRRPKPRKSTNYDRHFPHVYDVHRKAQ
jgi:hypothetical protein